MELEEMRDLWLVMSSDIEKQKMLTGSLILRMTRINFRNRLSKILIPELVGAFICLAGIWITVIRFQGLDTWYLQICGVLTLLLLILLPVISIKSIVRLQSVNISGNNYRQSLEQYARRKIQFLKIQKWSFYLGAVLLLVILPVFGKLISGMNLFQTTSLWMWYVVAYPFFYGLSRWVFRSYSKAVREAEKLLEELDNN
jgi:hypothetical protein